MSDDWSWYDKQKLLSHTGWSMNRERSTPDRAVWVNEKGANYGAIYHQRDGMFLAQKDGNWANDLYDTFAEAEAAIR